MGDPSTSQTLPPPTHKGILRFSIPDESVPAHDRSLFAGPASKSIVEHTMPLNDARLDPSLQTGADSLDTHGFTYIKHRSALSESGAAATDWFHGNNVEDIYLPEVTKLICSVTGAKHAIVNNVAFRRRLADKQVDPTYFNPRDGDLDKELAKLPKDVTLVYGKQTNASLEPARIAHIDYTLRGLQNTVLQCRHDILAAYQASQLSQSHTPTHPPRIAAYSLWRPLRPVHRDPLALCSHPNQTPTDLIASPYRALSDITPSGEYMMESAAVLPPADPDSQKWYWMPEQREDEVLIVKFADSMEVPGGKGGICGGGGAPHCSPIVVGTGEGEEARVSVEARVLAFW